MNVEDKNEQGAVRDWVLLWFLRLFTLGLGILAFGIAFVCCCTATGLAFVSVGIGSNFVLAVAIVVGIAAGWAAFSFVIARIWPKS